MKKQMLVNAVHPEQKRMAIVEDGKLVEFNIQMAVKEPITGNIYKGIVMKVERGLQAAFVNYGGRKDGFLPLKDVSYNNFSEPGGKEGGKTTLKVGQEILVQVLREVSERKGALLTGYISLPGRYLVLLPNKESSGISRKIEDEGDRKRLKELVAQITTEEGLGFIVRTAGMNRTKQELARDYQHLSRLWKEIQKRTSEIAAPALIYQESAFGVRSLRDYFTPDVEEILVDDMETFRQMRAYCKAVAPRMAKVITLDKEKSPLFDKYQLEDQIRVIYQDKVELKSGGYLIINPTEAMITIDVNSGRGSSKRNVEETAFKTNMEAAEEIARQLRLRDLGGLVVIDFIDMMDQKHSAEVEKVFKKAIDLDRARIQLSHISKFGIMELSRQKKQSTIQEISYTPCPFCRGRGTRPSLEYTALTAYRKIETQAVKGLSSHLKASLPYEVADYLLNQKRSEFVHLESECEMTIHISGSPDMAWDECRIETTRREAPPLPDPLKRTQEIEVPTKEIEDREAEEMEAEEMEREAPPPEEPKKTAAAPPTEEQEPAKKKSHRRSRHRRKKPGDKPAEAAAQPDFPSPSPHPSTPKPAVAAVPAPAAALTERPISEPSPVGREFVAAPAAEPEPPSRLSITPRPPEIPKAQTPTPKREKASGSPEDPLQRLKKVFETLID
jgi:ribonuclease E